MNGFRVDSSRDTLGISFQINHTKYKRRNTSEIMIQLKTIFTFIFFHGVKVVEF